MSAQGILASYEYLDSTVDAIENLKKAGFDEIKAYAPYPEHHIEPVSYTHLTLPTNREV